MHRFYLSLQLELSIIQTSLFHIGSRVVDWNANEAGLNERSATPFQLCTEALLILGSERTGGNRSPIPLATGQRGPAGPFPPPLIKVPRQGLRAFAKATVKS